MATKIYKTSYITQILRSTAAALLLALYIVPTVSAATSTYAFGCSNGGTVKIGKTTLSCSDNSTVTVQGVGTKAEAAKAKKPYPTTTDLTVISVNWGKCPADKLQLGSPVDGDTFSCSKGKATLKQSGKVIQSQSSPKKVIPAYGVDTATGKTVAGSIGADQVCVNGTCGDPAADPNVDCSQNGCDLIEKYVNPLINLGSICFGLIAIISIIAGGIQYSASTGDAQKVTAAKKRITNTLIAVVAYFFLYAFLQFLVPGGLFKT